ncbi:type VII secretion system-associated protein [Saccharopolyspora sp. CA-218241]|uniref:type VII secretion system-associated protein n=1 Tax=Saccharopolyspora sp. CA-218241 TaxID=3240027 RepID=UPI003D955437
MDERAGTDERAEALADARERAAFGPDDRWYFLLDPAWEGADEEAEPPSAAVVGGWFVEEGEEPLFRPNPDYEPSRPGLPTDPVDAALQLVVEGAVDGGEVLDALGRVVLGLAVDEEGTTVVTRAPDELLSVLVATAPAHRRRVPDAWWVEVTIDEIADGLPESGLDVLLNPGAPASMRIGAATLKDAFATEEPTEDEPEPAPAS